MLTMDSNVLIFILLLFINIGLIHTVDYTCTPGQDCSIVFNTYQNVYQSTITCPQNYACDITCRNPDTSNRTDSYQVCQETTIIASSSTTVTINCDGLENCKKLNFIGSNNDNANITVNCDGINTCNMASFNFQSSSYVSINCISDDSCTSAELDIKNPKLFNIYTTHIQSNLMLYSYNILYGDILQCDSDTHNCFIESKILCNNNYSDTCDIT
eukprot:200428_1